MAENVLEKIINKKIEKIVNLKKTISLESLDELINTNKTFINFKEKPFYFHSCDGHWSEYGNNFAANVFLDHYKKN